MTEVKQLLEARLRQWFANEAKQLRTDEARVLLKYAEQVILRAGKRARPRLLYATYEAYGGTDSGMLLDIGLALELHHQFLLIHDDVMDDDIQRYDGPNITGYYLEAGIAKPIATSMAILAGNLLFSYADQIILTNDKLSADQKVALLQLLHQTNSLVQQGQQLDILEVTDDVAKITEPKFLTICTLKTAAYTVQLPMQMAAELRQLPQSERQAIDSFAEAFGILYQLVDDYSDYFPNASSMDSHPKFRDFQQGKVTYPLWHFMLQASAADTQQLQRLLGNKRISKPQQRQVINLLQKYQADKALAERIGTYQQLAITALQPLTMPESHRSELAAMVTQYQI